MKIRLLVDLPIDPIHGCTKGREYEVTGETSGRHRRYFFMGDQGEECAAFDHEVEFIEEAENER